MIARTRSVYPTRARNLHQFLLLWKFLFNAIIWSKSGVFTRVAWRIASPLLSFFCLSYLLRAFSVSVENVFLCCWVRFIQSRMIHFFSTFLVSYKSFESKAMLSVKELTMRFDLLPYTLVGTWRFLALFRIASFFLCGSRISFWEDPVNYFLFDLCVSSVKLLNSVSNRYLTFADRPHIKHEWMIDSFFC